MKELFLLLLEDLRPDASVPVAEVEQTWNRAFEGVLTGDLIQDRDTLRFLASATAWEKLIAVTVPQPPPTCTVCQIGPAVVRCKAEDCNGIWCEECYEFAHRHRGRRGFYLCAFISSLT